MALVLMAGVLWSVQGLLIRQIDVAGTWTVLFWRSLGMIPVLLTFIAARSGGRVIGPIRSVGMVGVLGAWVLCWPFPARSTRCRPPPWRWRCSSFPPRPSSAPFWGASSWAIRARHHLGRDCAGGGGHRPDGARRFCPGRHGREYRGADLGAWLFAFHAGAALGQAGRHDPGCRPGGMFSMVAGAAIALATGQMLVPPVSDILYAVGMGAISLVGGMVLYTLGSRVIPAAELTLFSLIEVMLAPIWVWLLMGKPPGPERSGVGRC
ncbi:EamA/RhaT family transporter [Gemmobacter lanyuensis]